MPTRVSLILRKENQKADGTYPVFLQLIAGRNKRYVSTGYYFQAKDWNNEKTTARKKAKEIMLTAMLNCSDYAFEDSSNSDGLTEKEQEKVQEQLNKIAEMLRNKLNI